MNAHAKLTIISLSAAFACALIASGPAYAAAATATVPITSSNLTYTYEEMLDFDIDRYLAKRAPHLRGHSEAISHWSGYSRISPKVLIALMEQETGVVTRTRMRHDASVRPFGNLSRANGFDAQVRDIAEQLQRIVGAQRDEAASSKAQGKEFSAANPLQMLYAKAGKSESASALLGNDKFAGGYFSLFNERLTAKISAEAMASLVSPTAGPTAFTLRLPYALDKSWWISGAHSDSGGSIMSSLDMNGTNGAWGSDQNQNYVRASAGGTFKRHSSCFAEVIHQYSWSTAYYHMDKLQFATNQQVEKGVYIGIPASTKTQALCDGGSSTGPHMHWTLLRYSLPVSIHNVKISGYTISANSTIQYDTNCNLNYLTKNGVKYCPSQYVPN